MARNRELGRLAAACAALTAVTAGIGFVCLSPWAGLLVLAAAGGLCALFRRATRARYRALAELSEEIDRVLHGAEGCSIADCEEGELSILRSEIAKMTLRIREQNQALRREKGRLADALADVAHQLRTPLTSANLILPLLRRAPEEGERRALLRELEGLFRQMDWLVTALLQLSRLDAGIVEFRREELEAEALIREAARPLLIPMELHGVTLEVDAPPGVQLTGDGGWLAEALRNILKNCLEHAGDGARIWAACRDTPLFTEITVRDSGPGFPPEALPRLFDRFYRGGTAGGTGFGIGLALCRTIVTGQGGTVTAKNHPQGGALFLLRFPK